MKLILNTQQEASRAARENCLRSVIIARPPPKNFALEVAATSRARRWSLSIAGCARLSRPYACDRYASERTRDSFKLRDGAPDCLSITANANARGKRPTNPEDRVSGDARRENYHDLIPGLLFLSFMQIGGARSVRSKKFCVKFNIFLTCLHLSTQILILI